LAQKKVEADKAAAEKTKLEQEKKANEAKLALEL
jgi:hypothetical protein